MKIWLYRMALGIVRAFVFLCYPLRVTGLGHVPTDGSAILCANHISNLDPLLLASAVKCRNVRFMAKAELFKFKMFAAVFRAVGVIPVRRGESDMGALRASMKVLKDGEVLGVFAQGHRDKTGKLAMESGVTLLSLRTGAPVIPVFIKGPYRIFRKFTIAIGPAVDLSEYKGKYDAEQLRAATDKIEVAVRALNND